ncbi:hypothetical protein Gotur_023729 [Gossypium turneri]
MGSGSNLKSNLVKPVATDDPKQARVEYPNTVKALKNKKNKGDNAGMYNKGYSKPIIVDQSKTKTTSHQVPPKTRIWHKAKHREAPICANPNVVPGAVSEFI